MIPLLLFCSSVFLNFCPSEPLSFWTFVLLSFYFFVLLSCWTVPLLFFWTFELLFFYPSEPLSFCPSELFFFYPSILSSKWQVTPTGKNCFRFFSDWLNRLKNKLLANYLRNRGNDLETVQILEICGTMLSNSSLHLQRYNNYWGNNAYYQKIAFYLCK